MLHVLHHLAKEHPAFAEAWIALLAWHVLPLKVEVGIKSEEKSIDKAGNNESIFSYQLTLQTYAFSKGTFSQLAGRFLPGCGQAGQSSASSPGFVALMRSSLVLCVHPPCLSSIRYCHWRVIHKNSLYRS
jgi:hypothetical protein